MILNYIKTAYRNILRNKFYTFLNILGLSIGFVVFIFLFLYVNDELTYDKHHEKHKRIYRIASDFSIANRNERFAIVPIPMGPAFKIEFPEVEEFCRFADMGNILVKSETRESYEESFYIADSTLFDLFTHKVLLGDKKDALTKPNTMIVTEKIAHKYFGNENPIGKFLSVSGSVNYMITAVIENLPANSHLKFDGLASASTIAVQQGADNFNSMEPGRFWNIGVFTYLLLNENSSMQSIHEKFQPFYDKYMKPLGDQINASFDLLSMPMADIHLKSKLNGDLPTGNIAFVYIFIAVGIFIILIAAINYMNMATARSSKRAREVGLRKVLGALKPQLIRQFLSESVLLVLFSMIIAFLLVYLLLGDFNTIVDKKITLNGLESLKVFGIIFVVALFIGLLSGSYPAFYLSNFLPVKVLKGSIITGGKNKGMLRKILVVFQFWIAIVMLIGTLAISNQLNFLKNTDLGFNKDNVVVLDFQDTSFRRKAESFKNELLTNPNIEKVTKTMFVPGNVGSVTVMKVEDENGDMKEIAVIFNRADHDFIDLFDIEILEGRDFDPKMGTDEELACIVNEEAVKTYGWKESPIGKKIQMGVNLDPNNPVPTAKVIGVMKNFYFKSLHNKIEPLVFFYTDQPQFRMAIKIKDQNKAETLRFIEEKWNSFGANREFDYSFLDQDIKQMYDSENKISRLFKIASALTILIALLGLLGLSSFITEQRTKEIGIRKVVGASLPSVLGLLTKEFFVLICIAFVPACVFAWWQFTKWLDKTFVYYQKIDWTIFVIAGVSAVFVGLITISYHIIKAASNNPVDAIKYE